MKKLMFAVASAAAMVCVADGIESNIVGYQANDAVAGYSMVTPTFTNLDGEAMPIDQLQCIGVADLEATVQPVNPDGTWGTLGYWFNAFEDIPAGWCSDPDGYFPLELTLEPGQAVFVYSKNGGKIQSSGEVPDGVTIPLPQGYSMFGNASVKPIAIDSFSLTDVADLEATVQPVNPDGTWGTLGYWFNAFEDIPAGWCSDPDGYFPLELTLEPGQSVFVYSKNAGGTASVPSALK